MSTINKNCRQPNAIRQLSRPKQSVHRLEKRCRETWAIFYPLLCRIGITAAATFGLLQNRAQSVMSRGPLVEQVAAPAGRIIAFAIATDSRPVKD